MRLPAVLVTPLHIRFDPPVRLSRSTPSVSLTERHLHLSSAGKTVSYNFSVLLQFYLLTICHHGGFNQRSWDIQGQHLFIFYENLFYKFIYRKWAYFVLTLQQSATLDQFQSHSALHKIFSNKYTIWFSFRDTITNISREVRKLFCRTKFHIACVFEQICQEIMDLPLCVSFPLLSRSNDLPQYERTSKVTKSASFSGPGDNHVFRHQGCAKPASSSFSHRPYKKVPRILQHCVKDQFRSLQER